MFVNFSDFQKNRISSDRPSDKQNLLRSRLLAASETSKFFQAAEFSKEVTTHP